MATASLLAVHCEIFQLLVSGISTFRPAGNKNGCLPSFGIVNNDDVISIFLSISARATFAEYSVMHWLISRKPTPVGGINLQDPAIEIYLLMSDNCPKLRAILARCSYRHSHTLCVCVCAYRLGPCDDFTKARATRGMAECHCFN